MMYFDFVSVNQLMKNQVGFCFSAKFSFNQNDVSLFSEVSGDKNPIHLDEKYAADTIFKKPIIHGFLSGSIFSKILGMNYPGEGTIYLKQNLEFLRPMYVEYKYIVKIEVLEINSSKGRALLKTEIYDENQNLTLNGTALVQNNLYKTSC